MAENADSSGDGAVSDGADAGKGGGDAIVLSINENAELTTVNCTEETKYRHWTIRGGCYVEGEKSLDEAPDAIEKQAALYMAE